MVRIVVVVVVVASVVAQLCGSFRWFGFAASGRLPVTVSFSVVAGSVVVAIDDAEAEGPRVPRPTPGVAAAVVVMVKAVTTRTGTDRRVC